LDFAAADPLLHDATQLWIANELHAYENDTELPTPAIVATRVSLPSDRSFESYDAALAHAKSPRLDDSVEISWKQAMLDVVLEYQITSDKAVFSLRPALARLGVRTTTVLRFLPPNGAERDFEYLGDPGLVRLDPRWYQAALNFVVLGFEHIMD